MSSGRKSSSESVPNLTELKIDQDKIPGDNSPPNEEIKRILTDARQTEYRDQYIAFIDLLGFRQIVMRTSRHGTRADETNFNKDTTSEIHSALSSVPEDDYSALFNSRYLEGKGDAQTLHLGVAGFSDNLVFWADETPEGFGLLIHAVFQTVREFMLRGFYCRGGIKLGELLVDDSGRKDGSRKTPIMFGPGFIHAYDLERRHAGDARIIICNETTRRLKQYKTDAMPTALCQFFNDYLFQSSEGPWQIDIFADIRKPIPEEKNSLLEKVHTIADKLKRVMEEYTEAPTIFRKLLAMAKLFNSALDAGENAVPGIIAYKIVIPASR